MPRRTTTHLAIFWRDEIRAAERAVRWETWNCNDPLRTRAVRRAAFACDLRRPDAHDPPPAQREAGGHRHIPRQQSKLMANFLGKLERERIDFRLLFV
jgi:hypothetical protein